MEENYRKILKDFLDKNEKENPCMFEAVTGILKKVLKRNLDEELKMWGFAVTKNANPLTWAIDNDRPDIIENFYKIKKSAGDTLRLDPELCEDAAQEELSDMGKIRVPSMFEYAADCNKLEIVKIIVKNFHGKLGPSPYSDVSKTDIDFANKCAITAATKRGHTEVVKYIMDSQKIQMNFWVKKRLFSAAVRGGQVETLMQLADIVTEKMNYPDDKCFCLLQPPDLPILKKLQKYYDIYDKDRQDFDNDYSKNAFLDMYASTFGNIGLMGGDSSSDEEPGSGDKEDSSDECEDLDDEEGEEANDETEDEDENRKVLRLRALNKTESNCDLQQLLGEILARNLTEEIKFWADVCTKAEGKNPLAWAVENGNTGVIEEYYKLDEGDLHLNPEIVQGNEKAMSLYEYAAELNQLDVIKIIFQNYPDLMNRPRFDDDDSDDDDDDDDYYYDDHSIERKYNESVLIAATKKGNIDLIKFLLNDLKLRIRGDSQRKLISCAFREGQGEIIKVFAIGLVGEDFFDDVCYGCCVKSPPKERHYRCGCC